MSEFPSHIAIPKDCIKSSLRAKYFKKNLKGRKNNCTFQNYNHRIIYKNISKSSRLNIKMMSQISNFNFRQVKFRSGLLLKFQADAFISFFVSQLAQTALVQKNFWFQCSRLHFFNCSRKIVWIALQIGYVP